MPGSRKPSFRELKPKLGTKVYEAGKRRGAKRRSGNVQAKKLLERLGL